MYFHLILVLCAFVNLIVLFLINFNNTSQWFELVTFHFCELDQPFQWNDPTQKNHLFTFFRDDFSLGLFITQNYHVTSEDLHKVLWPTFMTLFMFLFIYFHKIWSLTAPVPIYFHYFEKSDQDNYPEFIYDAPCKTKIILGNYSLLGKIFLNVLSIIKMHISRFLLDCRRLWLAKQQND